MENEGRWCPACAAVYECDLDSWDCPECATKLWTYSMIWQELDEALRLRPPSKGAKYAEAGRLRRELYTAKSHIAYLESSIDDLPESLQTHSLERELAACQHKLAQVVQANQSLQQAVVDSSTSVVNGPLRRAATVTLEWLQTVAKGSSPKKSVLNADVLEYVRALQSGLRDVG